jgi:hypothetical protein
LSLDNDIDLIVIQTPDNTVVSDLPVVQAFRHIGGASSTEGEIICTQPTGWEEAVYEGETLKSGHYTYEENVLRIVAIPDSFARGDTVSAKFVF